MKHYCIPMLVTSVVTAVLWLTGVTTAFKSLMLLVWVMGVIVVFRTFPKYYSIPMLVTSVVTAVLWLTGVTTLLLSLSVCGCVMAFITENEGEYMEAYGWDESKESVKRYYRYRKAALNDQINAELVAHGEPEISLTWEETLAILDYFRAE